MWNGGVLQTAGAALIMPGHSLLGIRTERRSDEVSCLIWQAVKRLSRQQTREHLRVFQARNPSERAA